MIRDHFGELDQTISNAKEFLNFAWVRIANLSSERLRVQIAKRFYSIASQHFGAMIILIDNGDFDSSAVSFYRIVREVHYKGMWALLKAPETYLVKIYKNDLNCDDLMSLIAKADQTAYSRETELLPVDLRNILISLDCGTLHQKEIRDELMSQIAYRTIGPQSLQLVITLTANHLTTLAEALCSQCEQANIGEQIAKRFTEMFLTAESKL